jgi:hypothetical protein
MNEMQTSIEKEQKEVEQLLRIKKWLLIELIYGYFLFETNTPIKKNDLAEFSIEQLEFIEQAIENRNPVNLERGA